MSEEKKKGLFARLREGLSKTRGNMTEKVDDMVRENRKIDEDFYEELEDILLMADCGLKATETIVDELKDRVKAGKVKDAAEAREMLKQIMVEQMDIPRPPLKWPMVMLLVGAETIREVIPFPMNKNAQDIMMGAPGTVEQKQLDELHIAIVKDEDEQLS